MSSICISRAVHSKTALDLADDEDDEDDDNDQRVIVDSTER